MHTSRLFAGGFMDCAVVPLSVSLGRSSGVFGRDVRRGELSAARIALGGDRLSGRGAAVIDQRVRVSSYPRARRRVGVAAGGLCGGGGAGPLLCNELCG